MFTLGHRNPQGLFYDKKNKIILEVEHGPQGGDEINILRKKITDGQFHLMVNIMMANLEKMLL